MNRASTCWLTAMTGFATAFSTHSWAQNSASIPALLRCGTHLTDTNAGPFTTPLTFEPRGRGFVARQATTSRPGQNVFEAVIEERRIAVRGQGDYENGRTWRWSFSGLRAGSGPTIEGSMLQQTQGQERETRHCTLTFRLPSAVPPVAAFEPPALQRAPAPLLRPDALASAAPAEPQDVRVAAPRQPDAVYTGRREADVAPTPPNSPETRASNVSQIPCEAFYDMDQGLTENAWRRVSPIPLERLRPADIKALKRHVDECARSIPVGSRRGDAMIRLNRLSDALEPYNGLAQSAEKAETAQLKEEQRRRELAATDQVLSSVEDGLRNLEKTLIAQPTEQVCEPSLDATRGEIVSRAGSTLANVIFKTSQAWARLESLCGTRQARADAIQQRIHAEQRKEQERAAKARLDEVRQRLTEIARVADTRDPDQGCSPTLDDTRASFASTYGREFVDRQIAALAEWRALQAECQRRDQIALRFRAQQEDSRKQAAIQQRFDDVAAYATRALEKQQPTIDHLNIPEQLSGKKVIVSLSPVMQLLLPGIKMPHFTIGQWAAMIATADPRLQLSGAAGDPYGDWGLAVKRPGERTVTVYLRLDGNELFGSSLQIGDRVFDASTPDIDQLVAQQLLTLSGADTFLIDQKINPGAITR